MAAAWKVRLQLMTHDQFLFLFIIVLIQVDDNDCSRIWQS